MSEILRSNSPYIITICSGKGGVGKSILTANLGFWLAQSGKKVLICDADLFFPNQHLLFGVCLVLNDVYFFSTKIGKSYGQIKRKE